MSVLFYCLHIVRLVNERLKSGYNHAIASHDRLRFSTPLPRCIGYTIAYYISTQLLQELAENLFELSKFLTLRFMCLCQYVHSLSPCWSSVIQRVLFSGMREVKLMTRMKSDHYINFRYFAHSGRDVRSFIAPPLSLLPETIRLTDILSFNDTAHP
jgi:hypothetical protein